MSTSIFIFAARCYVLASLISPVLLFVEEVGFIVPALEVNYGRPRGACVKLMNRVNPLSRRDTNKTAASLHE